MEYELSLKSQKVRVWLWIMVPAFILTYGLFAYLPTEFSLLPTLPLTIGYFSYLGWVLVRKKK
ncbi:hypothetical protein [Thalassobacillus pellis]|uniref:hypothetical protein n=1 Tax=Thalassobacillus pellis TaxID=748008 RepID=UPI0019613C89|nr:hypothetical protein [Thalassobacillus pellis]MBM7553962.1 hypothetical protein [Thalassobacillus pellis]